MADTEVLDRVPPNDVEAEASVLGALLLSRDAITDIITILKGDEFYSGVHETIYRTIVGLYNKNIPADAITVAAELEKNGDLVRCGGAPYLHTLTASVPTAANATYYAHIVRDKGRLRRLVTAGTRIAQLGYAQDGGEVDELVNKAQAEMYAASENSNAQDYMLLKEAIEETFIELEEIEKEGGKRSGVPTGFTRLDQILHGLHAGQMIIVAARPAMGKSTLSLDFCRGAAIGAGVTTAIFSLEMSRSEIVMRLISAESNVNLKKMRSGTMDSTDWERVVRSVGRISDSPLFIDDSPNMTIPEIRSKCRRLKQQYNLGMVVVDYLQLMTSGKKVESRQQEVSEFSRALKLLAKELHVPVVAVAQLNRGPESRSDHRPMMSDLRESGSLEQDADVIMLLHRPEVYNAEDRPGEADIIIAKHRNGETATVSVAFQGHKARFRTLANE